MAREKLDWFEVLPLERRVMLAFAELTGQGTLLINGTENDNQITVSASADGSEIISTMDGGSLRFPLPDVKRLYVDCGAGNDSVRVSAKLRGTILGGDGSDSITSGPLADSIDGGAGDDTINGEAGSDTITGGDGSDTLEYGDRSVAFGFLIGVPSGAGTEPRVPVTAATFDRLEVDQCTDFIEVIGGTQLNDIFAPDVGIDHPLPGPVTLLGRGGNDRFDDWSGDLPLIEVGGPGSDTFGEWGGTGPARSPTLLGGPGNDRFEVDREPDLLDGGPGGDTIISSRGPVLNLNDFVSVENAIDTGLTVIGTPDSNYITLYNGAGAENEYFKIFPGAGNDTIIGNRVADSIDGGDGDDVISGGGGNDTIRGGNGNDIINGNSGNDRIYGGAGNDTLIGGRGRDHLYGEAGDDYLSTRDNRIDILYGGAGDDSGKVDHKTINDIHHEIEKLV